MKKTAQAQDEPKKDKPCQTCGTCPTCGHTPKTVYVYQPYPYYVYPFQFQIPIYTYPQWTCTSGATSISSVGNVANQLSAQSGWSQYGGGLSGASSLGNFSSTIGNLGSIPGDNAT